jgi:hypothetical protein
MPRGARQASPVDASCTGAFPTAFRDLVVPPLRLACRLQALSIARERCSFTDAYFAVWHLA